MALQLLVTYLEMLTPPRAAALAPPTDNVTIARRLLDPDVYLGLYRAVGEPWGWDQRLSMSRDALRELLESRLTCVYVLDLAGAPVGFCEFERVGEPEIELANFGLIPAAQGKKFGPFLLDRALRDVWSRGPRRVWLRTDANDHPKAIATYQRAGFQIVMSRLEMFAD